MSPLPQLPPLHLNPADVHLTISRSKEDPSRLTVDNKYVHIGEDATVRIIWTLDDASLAGASFDKPGILMFTDHVPALGWTWEPRRITTVWSNTNPERKAFSYHYRIYVMTPDGILHHDPVVRNDPPTEAGS